MMLLYTHTSVWVALARYQLQNSFSKQLQPPTVWGR